VLAVNLIGSVGLAFAAVLGAVTAAPPPSPAPTPLTTIGRTISRTPACTVLRELVAPSLGAAMDASAAFDAAQARLGGYGDRMGGLHPNWSAGTLDLQRIEPNITAMVKDVRTISSALGDKRVAAGKGDEQVRALREALQALYDAENDKLNALTGFTESHYLNDLMTVGDANMYAANLSDLGNPPNAPSLLSSPYELPEGQQSRPTVSTGPDHKPNLLPDYVPVQPGRKLDPNSPAARYAQLEARAAERISAIADVCR
jgi:hypothetical protein